MNKEEITEKAQELTIKNVTDGKNKYFSWGFYKGCVVGNAQLKSKNCWKTCEYAEPKSQWISQHIQDVEQLTKAKEIIKKFLEFVNNEVEFDPGHPQEHTDLWNELCEKAEQFISEVEQC